MALPLRSRRRTRELGAPYVPCVDESDDFEIFSESDDLFQQIVTSETALRRMLGGGFLVKFQETVAGTRARADF